MHDKLKKIIFNKLYEDLSGVEIIPHRNSIWFIGRDRKYWYLRYKKNGELWWRYNFFTEFFRLFSMEELEFQWVISEWVEEVLNCKVETPYIGIEPTTIGVEEVLNCKVETPGLRETSLHTAVEEVLNCKVETPAASFVPGVKQVEEVLNCKVETPTEGHRCPSVKVEEVLNCKVETPPIGL